MENRYDNSKIKAIFIPGNGGSTPNDNWFPWLKRELESFGVEVINVQFPDPVLARREFWLPFIESLGTDERTVLIGHSSGAVAAMRYAETRKILGSILVAGSHTDLGYESEKESHYYDGPWNWDAIRQNQQWVIQFASKDDPYIPIEEARFIHEHTGSDYYEYENMGHFGWDVKRKEFPELLDTLKKRLENI